MKKKQAVSLVLLAVALSVASFAAMAFRGQITYFDAQGNMVGLVRAGCGTDIRWGIVTDRYVYAPCNSQ